MQYNHDRSAVSLMPSSIREIWILSELDCICFCSLSGWYLNRSFCLVHYHHRGKLLLSYVYLEEYKRSSFRNSVNSYCNENLWRIQILKVVWRKWSTNFDLGPSIFFNPYVSHPGQSQNHCDQWSYGSHVLNSWIQVPGQISLTLGWKSYS